MKTLAAILTVILILQFPHVYAQSDSTKKLQYVVKADLLLPALSIPFKAKAASITFELLLKKRHAVQLTGAFIANEWWKNGIDGLNPENFLSADNAGSPRMAAQLIFDYKFFLNRKKQHTGFYTGGFLKYYYHNNGDYSGYPTGWKRDVEYGMGGGTIIGWQSYLKKKLVVDCIIGLGYSFPFESKRYYSFLNDEELYARDLSASPFPDLRWLSLNLGYRF